jgi:hypothetical protein
MNSLCRILVVGFFALSSTVAYAEGESASGSMSASAATTPGGIGIGAEAMLSGPAGLAVIYDAGSFHIDGIIGFHDDDGPDDTTIALGGRFLYHLHSAEASDFSIGGGLGLVNLDRRNNDDDRTDFVLEGIVQLRAFVVSNVALSASAGVAAVAGDDDDLLLGGQLIGSVGIAYYFF